MSEPVIPSAEVVARRFHEVYEERAPAHGYKTREASAVPWEDVPAANKALMIEVAGVVVNEFLAEQRAKPLDEAREHIGAGVVYRPYPDKVEQGVITSVNDTYVFVRYGSANTSQATRPGDLRLLAAPTEQGGEA